MRTVGDTTPVFYAVLELKAKSGGGVCSLLESKYRHYSIEQPGECCCANSKREDGGHGNQSRFRVSPRAMLRNQHRLHNASVFSLIGNVDLTIAFPNLAQIQNTLVFTLYGQLNGFICELGEEERKEAKKKRGRAMEDWINRIKQLVETRLIEARR